MLFSRPHRHQIDKWELVSVIQGQCLLIFTSDGVVKDRIALGFGGTGVAEIPGGSWHSVVFRVPSDWRERANLVLRGMLFMSGDRQLRRRILPFHQTERYPPRSHSPRRAA